MNEVTLRINTRIVERIFWIILVLVLLIALVWTNSGSIKDKASTVTDKISDKVADVKESSSKDISTETKTTQKTETKTETTSNNQQTTTNNNNDDTTNEPSDFEITDGKISLVVTDLLFKFKGDDWGRVEQINFKILNGKEDFIPTLEISVYGDNETAEDNSQVLEYDDDKKSLKGEIFSDNNGELGISLSDVETTRTFEVVLKNEDGDTLDTYKKDMRASDLKMAR